MSRPAGSGQVPLSQRELRELAYSPEAVGVALHNRRVSQGLSRSALARQIRVTEGTIHNWEQGKMPIAAARVLSYVFAEASADELWRERALPAEAALKRITESMARYRGEIRRTMHERRNGGSPDE